MELANSVLDERPIDMDSPKEFSELYECHYDAVYRTALRITGNPADAEDALQTVFLRVLSRQGRLDSGQMPGAYFRRAAANAAIDLLRRRMAGTVVQLQETTAYAAKETTSLLKEQLRRALASLEQTDAAMFLLRYVEGFTNGELAEMYGLEKNNIAVRLHRIRQTLQAEMER